MTQDNQGPKITFTLDVPESAVQELQKFMDERGIHFDPRSQVTQTNDAFISEHRSMGHEAGEIIQEINRYLEKMMFDFRINPNHQEWSLPELQQFLEFSITNFYWQDGKVTDAWWDGSPDHWIEVLQQYQQLFKKN